jgi:hypothetical protein
MKRFEEIKNALMSALNNPGVDMSVVAKGMQELKALAKSAGDLQTFDRLVLLGKDLESHDLKEYRHLFIDRLKKLEFNPMQRPEGV